MRIYLDSNIFQRLKKESFSNLLQLINEDKKHNIYCYSEAHVLDLVRDSSNHKNHDLEFIEKIVDDNFWHYNKEILFDFIKPLEYLNSIDTETNFSIEDTLNDNTFPFSLLKNILLDCPLPFNEILSQNQTPSDFPESLKKVFLESTNMYEFTVAFTKYSNEIADTQKKFKEQLKFLKENQSKIDINKHLGIEGFENGKLIDKIKFRDTLIKYFLKDKSAIYKYDLFLSLYNSLEIFGFVNGSLKKQELPNMINDGRHAFFGSYCDIVVSLDKDFVNKTKFIYDLFDIKTNVLNLEEYQNWLEFSPQQIALTFLDLIKECNLDFSNMTELLRENQDEKHMVLYKLDQTYFSYFDVIGLVFSEKPQYYFFTKDFNNQSSGTFIKEIKYVTNRLINELGCDINGNGEYKEGEIIDGIWQGRVWLFENVQINLNIKNKIYLCIYPDNASL